MSTIKTKLSTKAVFMKIIISSINVSFSAVIRCQHLEILLIFLLSPLLHKLVLTRPMLPLVRPHCLSPHCLVHHQAILYLSVLPLKHDSLVLILAWLSPSTRHPISQHNLYASLTCWWTWWGLWIPVDRPYRILSIFLQSSSSSIMVALFFFSLLAPSSSLSPSSSFCSDLCWSLP